KPKKEPLIALMHEKRLGVVGGLTWLAARVQIEQARVLNLLERHGSGFERRGTQLQLRDSGVIVEVFELRELVFVVEDAGGAAFIERSQLIHTRTGRCTDGKYVVVYNINPLQGRVQGIREVRISYRVARAIA